ncbi:hypothetical protein [Amycolatopsis sp. NPDC006125]|uniref:hypothetical protein n=1 Tax=Amycolatopsis sp. NPDC006125 TaxID=3156730 RepID=UPI0033A23C2B
MTRFEGLSEPTLKALRKLAEQTGPKINIPSLPPTKAQAERAARMRDMAARREVPAMQSLSTQLEAIAKNSPTSKAIQTLLAGMSHKVRGFDTLSDELLKKLAAAAGESAPFVDINAAFSSTVQSLGEQRRQALRDVERHTDALRAAVIAASEAGWSEVDLADTAGVDRMTIRRWLAKR